MLSFFSETAEAIKNNSTDNQPAESFVSCLHDLFVPASNTASTSHWNTWRNANKPFTADSIQNVLLLKESLLNPLNTIYELYIEAVSIPEEQKQQTPNPATPVYRGDSHTLTLALPFTRRYYKIADDPEALGHKQIRMKIPLLTTLLFGIDTNKKKKSQPSGRASLDPYAELLVNKTSRDKSRLKRQPRYNFNASFARRFFTIFHKAKFDDLKDEFEYIDLEIKSSIKLLRNKSLDLGRGILNTLINNSLTAEYDSLKKTFELILTAIEKDLIKSNLKKTIRKVDAFIQKIDQKKPAELDKATIADIKRIQETAIHWLNQLYDIFGPVQSGQLSRYDVWAEKWKSQNSSPITVKDLFPACTQSKSQFNELEPNKNTKPVLHHLYHLSKNTYLSKKIRGLIAKQRWSPVFRFKLHVYKIVADNEIKKSH